MRGAKPISEAIDIKVTAAAENAPRLMQEADALARSERTSITHICGVPINIDIEASSGAPNGATDAPDDIFLDYEIDVAYLYIYGVPLFTNGMRYASLKSTFHPYCEDNLRARCIATALERADQKLTLIQSRRPGVTDPAAAHEDLTLAGRYLFVAGFSCHRRFPVSL